MSYGKPGQGNPYSTPQVPQGGELHSIGAQPLPKVKWPGVVSICAGLLSGLVLTASIGMAAYYVAQTGPDAVDEESAEIIIVGLLMLAGVGGCLLGLTIGVIAIFFPQTNRLMASIGIAVNLLPVLAVLGLVVIGLVFG